MELVSITNSCCITGLAWRKPEGLTQPFSDWPERFLHHSWCITLDDIFAYCRFVSLIPLRPGLAPGWHLEYIDVKDEIMDKTFRFPCDRWLAKSDDDGQIMRELACANNDYLDLNEKTSKASTYNTF